MILMRLGMNDEPDRLGGQFLERRHNDMGILRRLPRVDQDNSFLGLDDRYIRVVELRRVNVNAVFDLFKLWTESPAPRSMHKKQKKTKRKEMSISILLS